MVFTGCAGAPSAPSPPSTPEVSSAAAVAREPEAQAPAGERALQLLPSPIRHLALSPDGRLLVIAGDKNLVVLDAATSRVRSDKLGCFSAVEFSASSKQLALASCEENLVRLWDLESDTTTDVRVSARGAPIKASARHTFAIVGDGANRDLLDLATGAVKPIGGVGHGGSVSDRGSLALREDHGFRLELVGTGPRLVALPSTPGAWSLSRLDKLFAVADGTNVRTVDPSSGKTLGERDVCHGRARDVEWTDAESELLVLCEDGKRGGKILALSPDLSKERLVIRNDAKVNRMVTRGERVLLAGWLTGDVVEIATGRALSHFDPREVYSASSTLDRVVGADARRGELAIFDEGKASRSVTTSAGMGWANLDKTADDALSLRDRAGKAWRFDLLRRAIAGEGTSSRDGKRYALIEGEQPAKATFFEGGTVKTTIELPAKAVRELSPNVKRVLVWPSPPAPPSLVVLTPNAPERRFPLDPPEAHALVSDDDARLAMIVDTHQHGGKPCKDKVDPACVVVRVFDLETGKPLSDIPAGDAAKTGLGGRLSADGRFVFIGREIYDTTSGKLLWSVEAGRQFHGFSRSGALAFARNRSSVQVIAADSGLVLAKLQGLDGIFGESENGGYFAASSRDALAIVKRADWTWVTVPAPPPMWRGTHLHLSDEGAFLWFVDAPRLVALRVADGEQLTWIGNAAPMSLGGAFDPEDVERLPFVVRRGRNVADAKLEPLTTLTPERAHPRLVEDFFAGRPIAPKPQAASPR